MIINGNQPKIEDQLPTKINAYQQASSPIVDLDESGLAQEARLFEKGNTLLQNSELAG